jgi:serine/threonine protein kinase
MALDVPKDNAGKLKVSCHGCLQKLDVSDLEAFSHVACPNCGADIIVPKWFSSYLLEEHWGIGGMADVYRALDPTLDREVAIKVLNCPTDEVEGFGEMFLNEGRIAANINHPAVIPIYSCGEFEKRHFLVMQFMEFGSLEQKLRKGEIFSVEQVLEWIIDITSGLQSAWKMGIVHHDVKPANILLDADNNAKIGDFGLANAIYDIRSEKLLNITRSWGSPAYVSPEKLSSGSEDYRGDIFSLGVTIYELLTRKCPFEVSKDSEKMLHCRLNKGVLPPSARRTVIDSELSDFVMTMLDPDPEERPGYDSIIEFMKNKRSELTSKSAGQGRSLKHYDRKKLIIATALSAVIAIISVGLGLWAFMPGNTKKTLPLTKDSNSGAIQKLFAEGKTIEGFKAARESFENPKLSLTTRRKSAMLVALGAYFNLDQRAGEICEVLSRRLVAAGVNPNAPELKVINFLANSRMSEKYLKNTISSDKLEYRQLAAAAIWLRAIYLQSERTLVVKKLDEFSKLLNARSGDKETWPMAVWKSRLPFYCKAIDNTTVRVQLEPAVKSLLRRKM